MTNCRNGHANPDHQLFCGRCGVEITPIEPGIPAVAEPLPAGPVHEHRSRRIWAIVGAVVAVVAVGAGIGAAVGSGSSKDTKQVAAAPEPATTLPRTTTTSRQSAMASWARSDASRITGMQTALQEVATTGTNEDVDGLHSACQDLHDANDAMREALPTPDPDLTAALDAATFDFDESAHHCISGTEDLDPTEISEATSYMNQATAHMKEPTAILNRYSPAN